MFAYSLCLTLIGYFAIAHLIQNERDLKRFLALLVGIHIYLSTKGILGFSRSTYNQYGYASTGEVGGSFLADENDLALALNLVLPLAIYLFRQAPSLPSRLFWGAGVLAILFTTVFTFSRGGFVGLTMMAIYWVATSRYKGRAIGGLVLALALVLAVAPPQYWQRMETILETDTGTARIRQDSWAAARRMFLESPIWGVGGNNFAVLFPDYALEFDPDRRGRMWGRATHSMYFQLLAEFGLMGVLLIGCLLLSNFRNLKQGILLSRDGKCTVSMGLLADCLRASWVGFLVPATFLSVLSYPHLYYLTALTVVVHRLASTDSTEVEDLSIGVVR
jgi:O-antigen ligase